MPNQNISDKASPRGDIFNVQQSTSVIRRVSMWNASYLENIKYYFWEFLIKNQRMSFINKKYLIVIKIKIWMYKY